MGYFLMDDPRKTKIDRTKMRAFHNNPLLKKEALDELIAHEKIHDMNRGIHWTSHDKITFTAGINHCDFVHKKYEFRFGIPDSIFIIEDKIYEGLPENEAKDWHVSFIESIPLNANLLDVCRKFHITTLSHEEFGIIHLVKPNTKPHEVLSRAISLLKEYDQVSKTSCHTYYAAYSANAAAFATTVSTYMTYSAVAAAANFASYAAYLNVTSPSFAEEIQATNAAICDVFGDRIFSIDKHILEMKSNYYKWMGNVLLDLLRTAPVE